MIEQSRSPNYQVKRSGRHEGPPPQSRALRNEQQIQPIVRATSWEAAEDIDIAEWIIQGRRLGSIGRAVSWWIGDWVNYGSARFGEKYSRAARITGYDAQSLMNMAYVAARFSCSRRRQNLSWSHHAEVAGLETDAQEMWLNRTEEAGLSVRGLREELRTWRAQMKELNAENQPSPQDGCDNHAVVCPKCGFKIAPEGLGDYVGGMASLIAVDRSPDVGRSEAHYQPGLVCLACDAAVQIRIPGIPVGLSAAWNFVRKMASG